MADDKKEAASDSGSGSSKPSKGPLILVLVNTLAVLGALGGLSYTRLIYKKPKITETGERKRLAQMHANPKPPAAPGLIDFEPVSVNIESVPGKPRPADGTPNQIHGKFHFVTVGFALEVRNIDQKDKIETVRTVLMDSVLGMLGRKSFHELTTVQGRYLLRTEILETANRVIARSIASADPMVTNVFFTHFVVQ